MSPNGYDHTGSDDQEPDPSSSGTPSRTPSPIPATRSLPLRSNGDDNLSESNAGQSSPAARSDESASEGRVSSQQSPIREGPNSMAKPKHPRMFKGLKPENIITTPKRKSKRSSNSETSGPSPAAKHRRLTRGRVAPNKVDYDMGYHPADEVLRPAAASKRAERAVEMGLPTRLGCRHSTRTKDTKIDYRTTHHPMDDAVRMARSTRISAYVSISSSEDSTDSDQERRAEGNDSSEEEDLFARPIGTRWNELEGLDRRIFILLQGAPLHGKTLPMSWSQAVQTLIREKRFSRKQFNLWGGEENLKFRYQQICIAMQEFFGAADEPSTEKDFKIYQAEGFDIYHREPASKKSIIRKVSEQAVSVETGDDESGNVDSQNGDLDSEQDGLDLIEDEEAIREEEDMGANYGRYLDEIDQGSPFSQQLRHSLSTYLNEAVSADEGGEAYERQAGVVDINLSDHDNASSGNSNLHRANDKQIGSFVVTTPTRTLQMVAAAVVRRSSDEDAARLNGEQVCSLTTKSLDAHNASTPTGQLDTPGSVRRVVQNLSVAASTPNETSGEATPPFQELAKNVSQPSSDSRRGSESGDLDSKSVMPERSKSGATMMREPIVLIIQNAPKADVEDEHDSEKSAALQDSPQRLHSRNPAGQSQARVTPTDASPPSAFSAAQPIATSAYTFRTPIPYDHSMVNDFVHQDLDAQSGSDTESEPE
ncbi:hypothetical protein MMC20_005899 [Loxospora ochrophaea]|nr:hypothetical protein [Loxospora ochrophaea]